MSQLSVTFRKWGKSQKKSIENFHNLLQSSELLKPDQVGPYEPLEYEFDNLTPEALAELVLDEESLLMHKNEHPIQRIYFRNQSSPKALNVYTHRIEDVEENSVQANTFCDYCLKLFTLFEPVYGRVCCEEDYRNKNLVQGAVVENAVGIDLRQYLPGIYWGNFFGPAYIEFFGEEKLLNSPAYETKWLGDAGILILVSESPFDYDTPEVSRREQEIIDFLGPDAFFNKSDPDSKEYTSPDFERNGESQPSNEKGATPPK